MTHITRDRVEPLLENASTTGFWMAGVGLGAIAMERVETDSEIGEEWERKDLRSVEEIRAVCCSGTLRCSGLRHSP